MLRHYSKSKTNKNFELLLGQITVTMNSLPFLLFVFFFQFNNDLAIIIYIVTDSGLNLFDDCGAECVGRRVYLFFLGTK